MSNPIAILLGAGASYPYGIPMMNGFYAEFRVYVAQRHPHCFTLVRQFETTGGHAHPDLETLLSDVQRVTAIQQGLQLIGGDQGAVKQQVETARELRGYLDAFIVDRCERFDRDRAARELPGLLHLHTLGPLWIFSTNYDRVVELACDAGGIPWSDGFEVNCPRPVADWTKEFNTDVRVIKLHGSVNWYEDEPGGALHRLDRGYSLPAHDFRLMRGEQRLEPLMIIPTLEKEALTNPYIGLAMKFADVLRETKLLIVAGNSLRDQHIKGYIRERLNSLHVLFVSPSAGRNSGVLNQPDRTHSLNAGFSEFLTLGVDRLLQLGKDIARTDCDSSAVGGAVQTFIAEVSRDVEEDASLRSNPELHKLWTQLENNSVTARIAAVKGLSAHLHPAINTRLTSMLQNDPEPPVRVAALDYLLHSLGADAVQAVGAALINDPTQEVQIEAALALISMGTNGPTRPWLEKASRRQDLSPVVRDIIQESLVKV